MIQLTVTITVTEKQIVIETVTETEKLNQLSNRKIAITEKFLDCKLSPLKRFRLLAQDMTSRSSATAIAGSNTVDSELISYFTDSKAYAQNDELHFWIVIERKCPHLSPLAQDLLSVPTSEVTWLERVFVLQGADSRQTKPSHQGP